jgi:hypothetical protein
VPRAIVIAEDGNGDEREEIIPPSRRHIRNSAFGNVEVLGASVAHRMVDGLRRGGIENVSLLSRSTNTHGDLTRMRQKDLPAKDMWSDAMDELAKCRNEGADSVLIMCAGAYIDLDVAEAFQFHAESPRGVIQAFDDQGALDLWIANPERLPDSEDLFAALSAASPSPFPVKGYVNRLETPHELRRLVVDALTSRCNLQPQAFQVRPGVWMGEGVHVEKEARIVAPAFIGSGVTISEQCLITRCSNVERNSYIDYGSAIEDTSVLPSTYVGIGLDVSHSIVDGESLLNLDRGVALKIGDPSVMRQHKPVAGGDRRLWTSWQSEVARSIGQGRAS